jgi:hypothetical protein
MSQTSKSEMMITERNKKEYNDPVFEERDV